MPTRLVATAFPEGRLKLGSPTRLFPKGLEVIRHQEDNQGWVTTVTLWPECKLGSNSSQGVLCDCHA
jgi:hypothetical protein